METDKNTDIYSSKSLNEVREWKNQVYLDTIDMDENDLIEYFRTAPERAAKSINSHVVYTSENTLMLVRDSDSDDNYNIQKK
ncbi:MAG: hypothetical protein HZB41_07425 [Ignavibacteriae bacterium]|nr:hypothetical protein [Ignavibacteriota bacterium]